jgi:hypothetical protein
MLRDSEFRGNGGRMRTNIFLLAFFLVLTLSIPRHFFLEPHSRSSEKVIFHLIRTLNKLFQLGTHIRPPFRQNTRNSEPRNLLHSIHFTFTSLQLYYDRLLQH